MSNSRALRRSVARGHGAPAVRPVVEPVRGRTLPRPGGRFAERTKLAVEVAMAVGTFAVPVHAMAVDVGAVQLQPFKQASTVASAPHDHVERDFLGETFILTQPPGIVVTGASYDQGSPFLLKFDV